MSAVRRSWISSKGSPAQGSLRTVSPRDGITVRLMGGLGNQLFIFGAGKALAKSLGCDAYFDVSWFDDQTLRQFELDFAGSNLKLVHSRATKPSTLARLIERCRATVWERHVFREESFAYDPNFWNVAPGTTIYGYFQSWKYLDPIAHEIRHMVLNATPDSNWFHCEQQKLKTLGPWTSLHVRRRDYTNPGIRAIHGLTERGYYERAIRVVEDLVGPQPIVVFSDDIASARSELMSLGPDMHFVETPATAPSLLSLLLMASAPASIIANSSFSWWGAWLIDDPRKVVVAPRPWFDHPARSERDLFPPHWITLGR